MRLTILCFLLICAVTTQAQAGVELYFAKANETTETSVFEVVAGQQLTVDLVMSLTDVSDTVVGYSVSVQYDSSELGFVSAVESLPNDFQFNLTLGIDGDSTVAVGLNQVGSFEASTFGSGASGPSAFRIGSIVFNAVSPTGQASEIDLEFGFFNNGIDSIVDDLGNDVPNQNFGSASIVVAAVPEPTSMAILSVPAIAFVTRKLRSRRLARA